VEAAVWKEAIERMLVRVRDSAERSTPACIVILNEAAEER
jgi:hypothetical protein